MMSNSLLIDCSKGNNLSKKKIMKKEQVILSDTEKEKRARYARLWEEYKELTSNPESSKVAVTHLLAKKYGVSYGTVYNIKNRMEAKES